MGNVTKCREKKNNVKIVFGMLFFKADVDKQLK